MAKNPSSAVSARKPRLRTRIVHDGVLAHEPEIVALAKQGYTATEICAKCYVSRTHMYDVLKKHNLKIRKLTPLERIERKCLPPNDSGCKMWVGGSSNGYPRTSLNRRAKPVATAIYLETYGDIPWDSYVTHTCGNTQCCTAEHLTLRKKVSKFNDKRTVSELQE